MIISCHVPRVRNRSLRSPVKVSDYCNVKDEKIDRTIHEYSKNFNNLGLLNKNKKNTDCEITKNYLLRNY